MSRYARKKDLIQEWFERDAKAAGYSVLSLHSVGNGCPDLLVSESSPLGEMWLVEIKAHGGTYTEKEVLFYRHWKGRAVIIASSFDEFIKASRG